MFFSFILLGSSTTESSESWHITVDALLMLFLSHCSQPFEDDMMTVPDISGTAVDPKIIQKKREG